MRKIGIILFSVLLLTGCSDAMVIEKMQPEELIESVLQSDITLYNHIFDGYKLYVPRGLKVTDKNKYNATILHEDNTFFLYVDIVSYHYHTQKEFVVSKTNVFSSALRFNDKEGYIDITEVEEQYFVEFMYNYAKIEAYVDKEQLNSAVLNMSYILSSIQFNDSVIETLIGENTLDYQEEEFDIFESKKEDSKFLDYIEQYDTSQEESKNDDQDVLDYEELE